MRYASAVLLMFLLTTLPAGAQGSLVVEAADGLISIQADRVGLGSLLGELDDAAGTDSAVPPGLENHTISVWFYDLPLKQAVRKIFEGVNVDYAVIDGNQIVVLNEAGEVSLADAGPIDDTPLDGFRPVTPSETISTADIRALIQQGGDIRQLLQGENAADIRALLQGEDAADIRALLQGQGGGRGQGVQGGQGGRGGGGRGGGGRGGRGQ